MCRNVNTPAQDAGGHSAQQQQALKGATGRSNSCVEEIPAGDNDFGVAVDEPLRMSIIL